MKPWADVANFYSVMAIALAGMVTIVTAQEFWRGGRVLASQRGSNIVEGMVQLARRNTRRYGGYLVHLGVAVIIIGFAGLAFNQDKEQELGNGQSMQIGSYTLLCKSYTQDDNPNYGSESAIIDVFRNGKFVTTMFPERRFYKASQTAQTMVANHSTPREDLYLIYAGLNPDTNQPIIKARINPLVMWIWIGVWIVVLGTAFALVPNLSTARVPAPARSRVAVGVEAD
jgi:cytochrome c-type biogenesis protein CcmF